MTKQGPENRERRGTEVPPASFQIDDPDARVMQRRDKGDRRRTARFDPDNPNRRSGHDRRTAR